MTNLRPDRVPSAIPTLGITEGIWLTVFGVGSISFLIGEYFDAESLHNFAISSLAGCAASAAVGKHLSSAPEQR